MRVDLSQLHNLVGGHPISQQLNLPQPHPMGSSASSMDGELHGRGGWVANAVAMAPPQPRMPPQPPAFPYGHARRRPASEAGDWRPPIDPLSPQGTGGQAGVAAAQGGQPPPVHPRTLSAVKPNAPGGAGSATAPQQPPPPGAPPQASAQQQQQQQQQPPGQPGHGYDWPLHRPIAATHRWRQGPQPAGGAAAFWFDPLYVEDPLSASNNVGRNCFRIRAIQEEFCKAYALATSIHPGEYEGEYPILARICKELCRPEGGDV